MPELATRLTAFVLIGLIRVAITCVPFGRIRRCLTWAHSLRVPSRIPPAGIIRAVQSASARVPYSTCLTAALAAELMLAWSGRGSQLRLGVILDSAGKLDAHAWLEMDGEVVLGEPEAGTYTTLERA